MWRFTYPSYIRVSFNSLFEMQGARDAYYMPLWGCFNSLFEMPRRSMATSCGRASHSFNSLFEMPTSLACSTSWVITKKFQFSV